MDRATKADFVQDFSQKLGASRLAIVTDYRGLDVNTVTEFRKSLKDTKGTQFQVVKNTLVRRAIADGPFQALAEFLTGPNAILLGKDAVVETAKLLKEFTKEHKELEIKGGVLDGKLVDAGQIKALADLPSKEVLQAMLLGVLQAPARNLVSLLANVNRQLLNVLVAYKDKLEDGAEG